jgi:hypothetical protein
MDHRRKAKPQIGWVIEAIIVVSQKRQTKGLPCTRIARKLGSRNRRIAMISCPLCHSKRIHRSRRKGILEQGILAVIFLRPFRCERCDYRFFRQSFSANSDASRPATTD